MKREQMHAAGLEAVTRWRTGQVTLRDSFSYLPDGSFQMGFGGNPGLGIANAGMGSGMGAGLPGFSNGVEGAVGNIPRLANTAILDVVQAINPVSAFTVAGGFTNSHFYDPTNTFLNGDQYTVQGGYSHLFSRHDQIGAIYGFQLFQFPQVAGGEIYNHIFNVRWSHTITGRLSFIAGIGPQYTDLEFGGAITHWSVSARAQLRYKFAHSSLIAGYEKYTSPGSGFFAGADTQAAHSAICAPWDALGLHMPMQVTPITRSSRILRLGPQNATSYNEGSAGAIFRKHLGRSYDFFGAYRFSQVAFNVPPGLTGFPGAGRIAQSAHRQHRGGVAPQADSYRIIFWPPRAAGLVNSMTENRELTMDDYLAMLRRRLKVILIPALLAPLAGFLVSYVFPPKYTSQSTVLVEGQKVPDTLVQSVITADFTQRIQTLSQQVLSPTRLRPVIQTLNLGKSEEETKLIPDIQQNMTVEPVITSMSAAAGLSGAKKKASASDEPVPGFNVNYTDSDAARAQKICNAMTSLIVDENLRSRAEVCPEHHRFSQPPGRRRQTRHRRAGCQTRRLQETILGSVAHRRRQQHAHADVAEFATRCHHPDPEPRPAG